MTALDRSSPGPSLLALAALTLACSPATSNTPSASSGAPPTTAAEAGATPTPGAKDEAETEAEPEPEPAEIASAPAGPAKSSGPKISAELTPVSPGAGKCATPEPEGWTGSPECAQAQRNWTKVPRGDLSCKQDDECAPVFYGCTTYLGMRSSAAEKSRYAMAPCMGPGEGQCLHADPPPVACVHGCCAVAGGDEPEQIASLRGKVQNAARIALGRCGAAPEDGALSFSFRYLAGDPKFELPDSLDADTATCVRERLGASLSSFGVYGWAYDVVVTVE